jgi:hypothetical protein
LPGPPLNLFQLPQIAILGIVQPESGLAQAQDIAVRHASLACQTLAHEQDTVLRVEVAHKHAIPPTFELRVLTRNVVVRHNQVAAGSPSDSVAATHDLQTQLAIAGRAVGHHDTGHFGRPARPE